VSQPAPPAPWTRHQLAEAYAQDWPARSRLPGARAMANVVGTPCFSM
jgi:hypothetical protein